MSNNSKQTTPIVARCGYAVVVPSAPETNISTYKAGNNSYEMQNTSRTVHMDTHNGTKTTTRYSQTQKGGEFVDRRSGNQGYREEVSFQKTQRVNDKAQGFTKEIQTQVKVKETTTYHNHKNSYNDYYRGSGSGGSGGGGYKKNNGGGYNNYDDYY